MCWLTASLASCHVQQQLNMDVCQVGSSTCLTFRRNPASNSDLILCWLQASSWHLRRGLGVATSVGSALAVRHGRLFLGFIPKPKPKPTFWLHRKMAIDSQETRRSCCPGPSGIHPTDALCYRRYDSVSRLAAVCHMHRILQGPAGMPCAQTLAAVMSLAYVKTDLT